MIIAHLPAGFISSKLVLPCFRIDGLAPKTFIAAGLFGSIAPDLDMIYFYGIDHRAHSHHTYFTHFPVVWMLLLILSTLWFRSAVIRARPALAIIFSLNGLIHMFLDYFASNIYWLAPFVNRPFSLTASSATYELWWLNFLLRRSFGVEIAIVVWAVCLWTYDKRQIISARAQRPGHEVVRSVADERPECIWRNGGSMPSSTGGLRPPGYRIGRVLQGH